MLITYQKKKKNYTIWAIDYLYLILNFFGGWWLGELGDAMYLMPMPYQV